MASTHAIDALIVHTAASYGGLVPTQVLREAGHSWRPINQRVSSGLLVSVCRGVVRLASTVPTPLLSASAAVLVSPGSWISHQSALAVLGLDIGKDQREADSGALGHVSAVSRIRIPGVMGHEQRPPEPGDVHRWNGIATARPWLAVVEAAATLPERDIEVAMDNIVQYGFASLRRVDRCLATYPKSPGTRFLKHLLRERLEGAGLIRSFFEHDLERLLRRAGISGSRRNYRVRLSNGRYRILDVAFPELRIALEADSWRHHSSAGDWGRTRIRDRELSAEGWLVIPVVYADIKLPGELLDHLREIIRQKTVRKVGFVTDVG